MISRRKTLDYISKGAIMAAFGSIPLPIMSSSSQRYDGYLVNNPYEGLDWERITQIPSTSHIHITNQDQLNKYYHLRNLRHIPISNYYPSAPYYPLDKIRYNQFKVKQGFGVVYNANDAEEGKVRWEKGKFKEGPFDWNEIIMSEESGWYRQLPPEQKKEVPFELGEQVFKNIPDDLIVSPNAEHHSFTNSSLHANAIGSMYSSGTFDAHNRFKTFENGYCYGTGLPWQNVFEKMIDALLFQDGGGITINHPVWSGLTFEEVCQMLDFDIKVLGIEVFNDTCTTFGDPTRGWAIKLWDEILMTGRKCLGFFVPDHTINRGQNMLLVSEFTEHECLKSYRHGAFYGVINGTGLAFKSISLANNQLEVTLNQDAGIFIVADQKQVMREGGANSYTYDIPLDTEGRPQIKYLRIEAYVSTVERIYSQPIMFQAV